MVPTSLPPKTTANRRGFIYMPAVTEIAMQSVVAVFAMPRKSSGWPPDNFVRPLQFRHLTVLECGERIVVGKKLPAF